MFLVSWGVEFCTLEKLSRFKKNTRNDNKNIPLYNCSCGGARILPVQKRFRPMGSAFGIHAHVVYGVNDSCKDQQRNFFASFNVGKSETRITRGGICGIADCGSQNNKANKSNHTSNHTSNPKSNHKSNHKSTHKSNHKSNKAII